LAAIEKQGIWLHTSFSDLKTKMLIGVKTSKEKNFFWGVKSARKKGPITLTTNVPGRYLKNLSPKSQSPTEQNNVQQTQLLKP
jgi:hypothetical protein